jgi:hypothetical protein
MITKALEVITEELNIFLSRKVSRYRNADTAILSDLVDQEGKFIIIADEKNPRDNLILTLINVEEETIGKSQVPYIRNLDHSINLVNPDIKLNLYVLFSAFSNMEASERYGNCLGLVDYVVRFFQAKSVFNHQNTPNLNPEIEKLIAELICPTFEQQNYLWGSLGAKYMPSVLYKIRMLNIREIEDSIEGRIIDKIQRDQGILS